MPRIPGPRARHLAAIVAAGLLVLTATLPVTAVTYSRETYEGSDAWSYDDCGPVVDAVASYRGMYALRAGTGMDEGAFFAHDNFRFHEEHVRRSDGKIATLDGVLNWRETTATRVEGSVFAFSSTFAGHVVMRDADGEVITRDRGTIRETILFDTLGDDLPGGEFIESLEFALRGQHPTFTSDAFCEFWNS